MRAPARALAAPLSTDAGPTPAVLSLGSVLASGVLLAIVLFGPGHGHAGQTSTDRAGLRSFPARVVAEQDGGAVGGARSLRVPAEEVAAAFAVGRPLVETADYKVHASRREKEGLAELHETDTDIVYVLGGSARLVTEGRLVGGKAIAPGELRGEAIEGGLSRNLEAGDVVIVPRGVPHWFRDVKGPLTYFVVKVASHGKDTK